MALTENLSVVTNDIQGPQKYRHHRKAVGMHFHEQHGTKTTMVFLPADGEVSWLKYLNHPECTYSCIHKVTGRV